jgi:hypothetical protein
VKVRFKERDYIDNLDRPGSRVSFGSVSVRFRGVHFKPSGF